MELKRIDVARQLWQMLRGILRDGGYVQSGSKMRNTANSFEDELYNPPKSEQGDSKNSSQAVQQPYVATGKAGNNMLNRCQQ